HVKACHLSDAEGAADSICKPKKDDDVLHSSKSQYFPLRKVHHSSPAMSSTLSFQVTFKGQPVAITDWSATSTIWDLKEHLSVETGIPPESQKLLYKGQLRDEATLAEAKILEGCKVMMVGSSREEVERVHEMDKRVELRKQGAGKAVAKGSKLYKPIRTVADDKYTFHRIEVIPEFPEPNKARALLERLRDDKGIRAIMSHYKWSVGALTELTPFERTLLGFNRNAGELISLRLRTNALDGFRHYDSIRKVLLHELAHNVWTEHDTNFHALDRQLNKDVVNLDWTAHGGHSVVSGGEFYNLLEEKNVDEGGSVMYESGTYVLGGGRTQGETEVDDVRIRREKIAKAALLRLTREEVEMVEGCGSREDGSGKQKQ
ncbi:WLM domain-containing protein, partial [Endogone sp. FLAS-F59071]